MVADLMPKVLPVLDWIRSMFMKLAELIAKFIETDAMNIYNILLIIISVWLSSKIIGKNYSTVEGRWGYLILLSVIFFGILRYLGVN